MIQFYIYQNSSNSKNPVEYKMRNRISIFNDLASIFKFKKLRLFNAEGAEFFQDDLKFVKNKTSLYASNGEQFYPHNCFTQYEIVKKLGHQGRTFLANHRHSGQKFVIKTINVDSSWDIDSIFVQSQILKSLKHENLIKIINCIPLKNMQLAIIMQYFKGQNLLQYINIHGKFDEQTSKIYIKQIINSIIYYHQNNLIYHNLKIQNILFDNKKIKIINFGLYGYKFYNQLQDLYNNQHISSQYLYNDYTQNQQLYHLYSKVDVWFIGIILYLMVYGELPYQNNKNDFTVENNNKQLYTIPNNIKKNLSKPCLNLIQRCLDPNPQTRITIRQLFVHDWFVRYQINYYNLLINSSQENNKNTSQQISQNQQEIDPSIISTSSNRMRVKGTKKIYENTNSNKKIFNNIIGLKQQIRPFRGKQNYEIGLKPRQ